MSYNQSKAQSIGKQVLYMAKQLDDSQQLLDQCEESIEILHKCLDSIQSILNEETGNGRNFSSHHVETIYNRIRFIIESVKL